MSLRAVLTPRQLRCFKAGLQAPAQDDRASEAFQRACEVIAEALERLEEQSSLAGVARLLRELAGLGGQATQLGAAIARQPSREQLSRLMGLQVLGFNIAATVQLLESSAGQQGQQPQHGSRANHAGRRGDTAVEITQEETFKLLRWPAAALAPAAAFLDWSTSNAAGSARIAASGIRSFVGLALLLSYLAKSPIMEQQRWREELLPSGPGGSVCSQLGSALLRAMASIEVSRGFEDHQAWHAGWKVLFILNSCSLYAADWTTVVSNAGEALPRLLLSYLEHLAAVRAWGGASTGGAAEGLATAAGMDGGVEPPYSQPGWMVTGWDAAAAISRDSLLLPGLKAQLGSGGSGSKLAAAMLGMLRTLGRQGQACAVRTVCAPPGLASVLALHRDAAFLLSLCASAYTDTAAGGGSPGSLPKCASILHLALEALPLLATGLGGAIGQALDLAAGSLLPANMTVFNQANESWLVIRLLLHCTGGLLQALPPSQQRLFATRQRVLPAAEAALRLVPKLEQLVMQGRRPAAEAAAAADPAVAVTDCVDSFVAAVCLQQSDASRLLSATVEDLERLGALSVAQAEHLGGAVARLAITACKLILHMVANAAGQGTIYVSICKLTTMCMRCEHVVGELARVRNMLGPLNSDPPAHIHRMNDLQLCVVLSTNDLVEVLLEAGPAAAFPWGWREGLHEWSLQLGALVDGRGKSEVARALAVRSCSWLRCTNLEGGSETGVVSKRCGGCMAARYCSQACQKAAWGEHRLVCRQLAVE